MTKTSFSFLQTVIALTPSLLSMTVKFERSKFKNREDMVFEKFEFRIKSLLVEGAHGVYS